MRLAHQLTQLLGAELLRSTRFAQADNHVYTTIGKLAHRLVPLAMR
jgi:hypothetical protein